MALGIVVSQGIKTIPESFCYTFAVPKSSQANDYLAHSPHSAERHLPRATPPRPRQSRRFTAGFNGWSDGFGNPQGIPSSARSCRAGEATPGTPSPDQPNPVRGCVTRPGCARRMALALAPHPPGFPATQVRLIPGPRASSVAQSSPLSPCRGSLHSRP